MRIPRPDASTGPSSSAPGRVTRSRRRPSGAPLGLRASRSRLVQTPGAIANPDPEPPRAGTEDDAPVVFTFPSRDDEDLGVSGTTETSSRDSGVVTVEVEPSAFHSMDDDFDAIAAAHAPRPRPRRRGCGPLAASRTVVVGGETGWRQPSCWPDAAGKTSRSGSAGAPRVQTTRPCGATPTARTTWAFRLADRAREARRVRARAAVPQAGQRAHGLVAAEPERRTRESTRRIRHAGDPARPIVGDASGGDRGEVLGQGDRVPRHRVRCVRVAPGGGATLTREPAERIEKLDEDLGARRRRRRRETTPTPTRRKRRTF